jgi:hypothetical protein
LVCAVIFYFVKRSRLKFEFINEFVNWKAFFLVSYGHGPKPSRCGLGSLPLRPIQVAAGSN